MNVCIPTTIDIVRPPRSALAVTVIMPPAPLLERLGGRMRLRCLRPAIKAQPLIELAESIGVRLRVVATKPVGT